MIFLQLDDDLFVYRRLKSLKIIQLHPSHYVIGFRKIQDEGKADKVLDSFLDLENWRE